MAKESNDTKTFSFNGVSFPHEVGNGNCPECWDGYPVRCRNCGGLVHAQFGDEMDDGYYLEKCCDTCEDYDEGEDQT